MYVATINQFLLLKQRYLNESESQLENNKYNFEIQLKNSSIF